MLYFIMGMMLDKQQLLSGAWLVIFPFGQVCCSRSGHDGGFMERWRGSFWECSVSGCDVKSGTEYTLQKRDAGPGVSRLDWTVNSEEGQQR